jgi:hypothetical protein
MAATVNHSLVQRGGTPSSFRAQLRYARWTPIVIDPT